jgi:hypothetical protein
MSTRGPRRWCPDCIGQMYFHHVDENGNDGQGEDVYYCQGCGEECHDSASLHELDEPRRARRASSSSPKEEG